MRWPLLALILLTIPAASAIVINEIMYHPTDPWGGSTNEWLEIYNNDSISYNLTNWKAAEPSDHAITGNNLYLPAGGFFIIARNDTKFLQTYAVSCPVAKASVSLSDSGEWIALKNSSGAVVANATFTNLLANGNNLTLSLANNQWRESLYDGGSPCGQNFKDHEIDSVLYQQDDSLLGLHLENNGLNDETINLTFFVDGNYLNTSLVALPDFNETDITFSAGNLTIGSHYALVNISYANTMDYADLNFTINPLPNTDVTLRFNISVANSQYIVSSYPENASIDAGIFLVPAGFNNNDTFIIGGEALFDTENSWWDFFSMVDDEADFGFYKLCGNILQVYNYNDTDLSNNFVCANFTLAPPASQTRLRIKTYANNISYDLNETIFWTAHAFPPAPGTAGNLTVGLQKMGSSNSVPIFSINNLNLTDNQLFSGNFTLPDDWVEGLYKVRAKFAYSNKYIDSRDSGQFWLNGLKDIGEANITILQTPALLKFGGFGTTVVKFFAGNYNYDKLRFLAYGYPSQVLMDTSGSALTASSSNAAIAVELQNVRRGETYYLALPEFAKQNCDSKYDSNSYRVRVRAYQSDGAGWKELTTSDYYLPLSDRIDTFCPAQEGQSTRVALSGIRLPTKPKQAGSIDVSVVDAPAQVGAGQSFTLRVGLKNNQNATKKLQVYSYIYSGKTVLTEGGWTGNAQVVDLANGESKTILLDNLVKDTAPLGKYILRVRAKVDGKDVDSDSEIEITENEQTMEQAVSGVGSPTGSAVAATVLWKSSKAGNLSVVALAVIAILLILVVALIKAHR